MFKRFYPALIFACICVFVFAFSACRSNSVAEYDISTSHGTSSEVSSYISSRSVTSDKASETSSNAITEEEAKQIALNTASLSSGEVTFDDDSVTVDENGDYEIHFRSNSDDEYSYKVDNGGAISPSNSLLVDNSSSQSQYISIESAMQIALDRVAGASSSDITIKLNNSKKFYKGSIVYNNYIYSFKIDALNGNLTNWDVKSAY